MIYYNVKYHSLLFLIVLSIFTNFLIAQTDSIMIEHISTEEGLSNKNVNCIFQDSYGFLWIGTSDGLNRYDGYEFVVYKNDVWDSTSLSSPIVKQLVEDNNGNIWVGTPSGLNFYQRKSDSFIRYTHNPENKYSISNNDNIESIQIDITNPKYIWVGTDGGGLNLLDISLQRFYVFKLDTNNISSLSGNKILSLYQDSFNDFWIGTSDAGLNKINLNSIPKLSNGKYDVSKFGSIKFERYVPGQSNSDKFNPSFANSFYEDNSGRLWILTYPHVLMFDREKNIIHSIPNSEFDKTHFHEMIEDEKGNFWFGEHNRVFRLVAGKNILDEYKLNEEEFRSTSNQGLCEDRNGNIWVATWDGIYKISEEVSPFERYIYNLENSSTPAGNYIYSILVDQSENIWIGTNSGLLLMVKGDNGIVRFTNYSDLHQLEIGSVESIVQDREGLIWLTSNYTLVRIDPENNLIIKYKNNQDNSNCLSFQQKLSWTGPTNLHIDNNNNLWIAAYRGGISKVSLEDLYSSNDMNNVLFINYFNNSDHPACTVQNFIQDRYGYLWICSQNGGVFMFDPEKEIVKNFNQDFNHTQSLSINYVTSVQEDKKGNLWFGTYGGGLNRFDRESESFTHFSIKDGLPSDIISGILEDDNGNLWISTNQGITKFNPDNNKIRNYDVQENEVSFHDTITGKMYFGNNDGFIVFHPDSIKESSYVPSVVLTKFTRYSYENDGEQIIDRTISAKKNIELTYKDDVISFEFAALSFDKNFNCKYSYKLEGFSNNWVNVGTKREVTFTNLDPGDYTFKVKACNEDGIWCSNYASIKLYISPPWWSTWWSYGIYGLLFISALYGIRRFELDRRKEKEDRRILELENERKTKELEQARKLQLSMLPKEIPCLPNLDIAVYMKTATEVGGDYYDFYESEDNTLNIVIGDATGHGLDAGMMVTAAKGLFQNLVSLTELSGIIKKFNNTLISMHLQPMHMGIMLTRIKGNKLEMVGAGMPSMLIYQNSTDSIRELESSGPPLGGFPNYKYETCQVDLSGGDVILLLSDGFEERFNINKEMLGDDKAKEILEEIAGESSDKIIERFVKECDEWGGDRPQDDDVTFVVIKVK